MSLLSTIPVALLLVCFARARASADTPIGEPSPLLSVVTLAAVVTGGIWVAYFTVALAASFALHPPAKLSAMADVALRATSQACAYVAPLIVWLQIRRLRQMRAQAQN